MALVTWLCVFILCFAEKMFANQDWEVSDGLIFEGSGPQPP